MVALGVRDRMHAVAPNWSDMRARPTLGPTQGWNAYGHKTNVASRPASVLRHFHRENPKKCIERRKIMQTDVGAVDGDANVWKSFMPFGGVKKSSWEPPPVDRNEARCTEGT